MSVVPEKIKGRNTRAGRSQGPVAGTKSLRVNGQFSSKIWSQGLKFGPRNWSHEIKLFEFVGPVAGTGPLKTCLVPRVNRFVGLVPATR